MRELLNLGIWWVFMEAKMGEEYVNCVQRILNTQELKRVADFSQLPTQIQIRTSFYSKQEGAVSLEITSMFFNLNGYLNLFKIESVDTRILLCMFYLVNFRRIQIKAKCFDKKIYKSYIDKV